LTTPSTTPLSSSTTPQSSLQSSPPSSSFTPDSSSTAPISSTLPLTSNTPTSSSSTIPSSTLSSSTSSPPSSVTSVLTAPVTTVVETTVVATSNGQVFTTVFSTKSTAQAGATITVGSDSAATSHSASHTGAIVGGVVGGVVGLLLLLLGVLLYLRHRRRLEDEAFDGNFDPNRIVRSPSAAGNLGGRGPTLPNIPVTNSDEHLGPEMAQFEDDGMGGRLNASTIGAGIVTAYPLYHATTPPPRSPPPSARSWGNSSDAHHGMYNGPTSEWRGPSPGPSIPTQYTGGSGSGSYGNSVNGTPPTSYPPGMPMAHLPPGASPGPAGVGVPASAYAGATHARRPSAGSSDRQHIYAGSGPGSGSNPSTSGASAQQSGSGRFAIANPDEDMAQNRYVGGISEDARRAYIAGGPSGKSPTGPSQPRPREILVHQDGGGVDNMPPSSEGPEEIPPTYDSLLGAAGMNPGPEKGGRY